MARKVQRKAETTIAAAARYLLWFARQHGDAISSLKLQKLLFYAQGWFLALHNRPLFQEEMQAWVHGPAHHRLYP